MKTLESTTDAEAAVRCSDWLAHSGRVLCRFSCGAASAVATKLAIEKYGNVEIYYNDTGAEHPDNARFMADCEKWFGQRVNVIRSEKYKDIWDCFEKRRFLVGPKFAVCTVEMKKVPGNSVWEIGDTEIYGYTAEEAHRLAAWREHNFERIIECPLIDRNLTKQDCLGMLERVGIELPAMYKLGFRNNNCIGCVKARDNLDYWKRVRKHFPAIFERMAKLERDIGTNINRVTKNGVRSAIYLDEIEAGDPKGADPNVQCGLFCMAEADALLDGANDVSATPVV